MIVCRAIDRARYFIGLEQIFRRRRDQRSCRFGTDGAAIEPQLESIRRNDHRHSVVNVSERPIGARRDNGSRFELFTVRSDPGLPQPGECQWLARLRTHIVWLPAGCARFPIVEAIGWY